MRDSPLPLAMHGVSLTLPSAAGPIEILREVDLAIAQRERVAVTGPSGSGKSSLIAVAAGLERPSAGRVLLFGEDLGRLNEDGRAKLRRSRVSLVFQAFHLLPNMTAEENVAAPLEIAGDAGARASATRCCSPTSPPAISTPPPPPSRPTCCSRWSRRSARRWCW